MDAHTGHRWRVAPNDLPIHVIGWSVALALTFAFSTAMQRYIGAGLWALRTALTLTTLMIMVTALGGLFHHQIAVHYWAGLAMLIVSAGALASPWFFDVYGLSAASLGLNTLLVGGMAHALINGAGGGTAGSLLILGVAAAVLLAATVSGIVRLSRQYQTQRELA
jgi:hypothetical protein